MKIHNLLTHTLLLSTNNLQFFKEISYRRFLEHLLK